MEGTEENIVNKFSREFQNKNKPKGVPISFEGNNFGMLVPNRECEEDFDYGSKWKALSNPFKI